MPPPQWGKRKKKGHRNMIYAVSAVTAVLLTVFFHVYMKMTGYFSAEGSRLSAEQETDSADEVPSKENPGDPKSDDEQKNTKDERCYSKKQSLLLTCVFFVLAFLINIPVYVYSYKMNEINLAAQPMIFFKLSVTHAICACAALTDVKRNRIPNTLIAAGLISRGVIYIPEFILARDFFAGILKNDVLGFAIGFVMLFTVAVITKGGIGYGDVKLFGVIGLMMGSGGVFAVLFLSLLFSSICSVFMMITKKKTLKSSLPMAPFIYMGFAAAAAAGLF